MSSGEESSQNEVEPKKARRIPPLALVPLVVFAALSLLFLYQLVSGHDPQKLPSALIDKPVPQFTLPEVPGLLASGEQVPGVTSKDLLGKVSIVNIFASWCGPCRAEHEYIMDLSKDDRVQMVGLNYKDKAPNAIRFLQELGNPYDRVGADTGRIGIEWGVYGVPETFIVGKDGNIKFKFVGPLSEQSYRDTFLPELERVLATSR
ncbi:DsbE family thiol:disulfide interchange protein [Rhodobacteraceae bacterium RKSG542]|uniref:DsbE family thiol:disulfide interchange protein n=1 Tax=Pseudovibrio flavus TaxID=2529854 RepID=UPI0012BC61A5|nr:DsbE family thiol:disulfide interchange protein [Pseudovibrio flavus]MTI18397.1 DsbE family thiol:disulfide interchange protein [Pseudovibrio flavus]